MMGRKMLLHDCLRSDLSSASAIRLGEKRDKGEISPKSRVQNFSCIRVA